MALNTFPALAEDKLRTLDQLRQRLNQLSTSLGSLKTDLERSEPVPTWSSLQSSAQIVSHNLGQLLLTFDSHREFLKVAHVYPLTTFPAHTQEALLNQLLRKRLDPTVEEWIKLHETRSAEASAACELQDSELRALWTAAGPISNSVVKGMIEEDAFEDDFTLAERREGVESVVTGLKRRMWDDDSDDEAGKAEDMEDVQRPSTQPDAEGINSLASAVPIEQILCFMSTGRAPL